MRGGQLRHHAPHDLARRRVDGRLAGRQRKARLCDGPNPLARLERHAGTRPAQRDPLPTDTVIGCISSSSGQMMTGNQKTGTLPSLSVTLYITRRSPG